MSDNENVTEPVTEPVQDDLNMTPEVEGEQSPGVAGPLQEISPEKLAELQERLAAFKRGEGTTASGSEGVDQVNKFNPADWEVEPHLMHLYMRSTLEQTPDGPQWVVMEHQYMIQTAPWHVENAGKPYAKTKQGKTLTHGMGLDFIINEIVNGPEGMYSREKGWRLSALLPGNSLGSGGIAVFERQVRRALPDPKPIVHPEEQPLEETTDEELARMQEKAQEWTAEQTDGDPDAGGTGEEDSNEVQ